MLSVDEFIRLSLELNLFFGRIAKEHSIFMETAFTAKNLNLAQQADAFKLQYEKLLQEALNLSQGVISQEVIKSEEIVTPYTLRAEQVSQFYTGVEINSSITKSESLLSGESDNTRYVHNNLENKVFMLNKNAINLTNSLIQFKSKVLNDVLSCRLFTTNYPLLLDHILREAKFYLGILLKLQNREEINTAQDLINQEVFWNQIMAEHSKFILGLLDPTEVDLINTAQMYGKEFDNLTKQAIMATTQTVQIPKVTIDSISAVKGIKDFKTAGTKGLTDCKIKAIAYPLLGDHVLREANHYLRILSTKS